MAFLFKIEGRAVMPNVETLLISPFKEIWNRDKTKDKENATEEFAYIEFMSSMRRSNPYRQYSEKEKEEVIKNAIINKKGWKPDNLVMEAIDKIKEFQSEASLSYSYYISAKRAAEEMKNFFNTVNIREVNPKTLNPLYKPKDITSALNDTEKVLINFDKLEKRVEEELYEITKNKANKNVSPFADPSSIIN